MTPWERRSPVAHSHARLIGRRDTGRVRAHLTATATGILLAVAVVASAYEVTATPGSRSVGDAVVVGTLAPSTPAAPDDEGGDGPTDLPTADVTTEPSPEVATPAPAVVTPAPPVAPSPSDDDRDDDERDDDRDDDGDDERDDDDDDD